MNGPDFKKVWVIAKSLLLSQLRASASGRGIRSLIRRPMILGILDLGVFVGASGICYLIGTDIIGSPLEGSLRALIENVIVILPAIIVGVLLILGLVLEVSSGAQFASSDTVNWLPVKASEYVAASALSLLIYYSVFPVAVVGATMSLAYVFRVFPAWELATGLSFFSIIVAASALEIVRAFLNRFSSSFYRRGGRAAQALRAIAGVLIIIVFQTIFYPTVYEHFLGVITPSFGLTWFVPILWASVSVVAFLNGELVTASIFAALSVLLSVVLFYAAVAARSKYWVPSPASIRISTAEYIPRARNFGIGLLLNLTQAAITRKDLRGLVRRREMLRLLALPGVFLVTSFLSASSGGFSFSIYFGVFIVAFSTLFMAMSSIGAEGKAIINLYQSPVLPKDFVVGKAVPSMIFGSAFGVIFYVVISIIFQHAAILSPLFVASSVAIAIEMGFLGLLIGMRFPNFTESPRASFVSQTAGLIAFPIAILVCGISISPLLVSSIMQMSISEILLGLVFSLVITAVACFAFYRFAVVQAKRLLDQIPV